MDFDSKKVSSKDLLYFYESSGVEVALSETPIKRTFFSKDTASCCHIQQNISAIQKVSRVSDLSNLKKTVMDIPRKIKIQIDCARKTARSAKNLEELKGKLESFEGCSLKLTAKNTCFADGTPGSALMLIGEAPGREEDIQALPFVGRSGKLLNLMLAAIGLRRDQVYIANTIPWRPPGNRTPTRMEIELCRPFIDRQIELAHPRVLIALGGPASKSLTGSKDGILQMRGRWHNYCTISGIKVPVMPTLHPAYLLRTPAQKKLAWNDFLYVKQKLSQSLNFLHFSETITTVTPI